MISMVRTGLFFVPTIEIIETYEITETAFEAPMDLITELSGIDSKHRISVKKAAAEIVFQGAGLYDLVFERALSAEGVLAERCAESCARAAREIPSLAQKHKNELVTAIRKNPKGNMRYFLASILINVNPGKKQAKDCARIIHKWLNDEVGKGAKACFLEAIVSLSRNNPDVLPLARKLIAEALKSDVASYSARARVVMGKGRKLSISRHL